MTHSKLEMDKVTGIDIGDYKELLLKTLSQVSMKVSNVALRKWKKNKK